MARIEVPLRAVVEAPPPGVPWALQLSKGDLSVLVPPTKVSAERLVFEFSIEADRDARGGLRLLGPGVQGPPDKRFFYLNTGIYAGTPGKAEGRRAKIGLSSLTLSHIEGLKPGQRLEVRFAGTAKDGGASCATVPLLSPPWRAV
jgi:hypothetical protein